MQFREVDRLIAMNDSGPFARRSLVDIESSVNLEEKRGYGSLMIVPVRILLGSAVAGRGKTEFAARVRRRAAYFFGGGSSFNWMQFR